MLREYEKSDKVDSEYLFHNSKGKVLNPSTINKVFDELAYSINEVSNQAGHTSIKTTMRYLNPNLDAIKKKAELL